MAGNNLAAKWYNINMSEIREQPSQPNSAAEQQHNIERQKGLRAKTAEFFQKHTKVKTILPMATLTSLGAGLSVLTGDPLPLVIGTGAGWVGTLGVGVRESIIKPWDEKAKRNAESRKAQGYGPGNPVPEKSRGEYVASAAREEEEHISARRRRFESLQQEKGRSDNSGSTDNK